MFIPVSRRGTERLTPKAEVRKVGRGQEKREPGHSGSRTGTRGVCTASKSLCEPPHHMHAKHPKPQRRTPATHRTYHITKETQIQTLTRPLNSREVSPKYTQTLAQGPKDCFNRKGTPQFCNRPGIRQPPQTTLHGLTRPHSTRTREPRPPQREPWRPARRRRRGREGPPTRFGPPAAARAGARLVSPPPLC